MTGFSAASVAPLSYDFTSFPLDGAENGERCTGKGRIPEPSKAALETFLKAFSEARDDLSETATVDDQSVEDTVAGLEDKVYGMLSDVCSGQPSIAELRQLPPRILTAFTRYLLENLVPKSLDERYEALAGDEDERNTLYQFRRILGYDADEVGVMPWWKRRMYVEGMNRELDGEEPGDVG